MTDIRFRLDWEGEAQASDGWTLVTSEREFLLHSLSGTRLFIKNRSACEWAMEFARARGWRYETVGSPINALISACPDLSGEQARQLGDMLGERLASLPRVHTEAILEALYPDGPWTEAAGMRHAAEWLLWLDENAPPVYVQPLLLQRTQEWQLIASEEVRGFYTAVEAEQARGLLRQWLYLKSPSVNTALGPFPQPIPARWLSEARAVWTSAAVTTRGAFFDELRGKPLPIALLEEAARAAFRYYRTHPDDVDADRLRQITRHLNVQEAAEARALCPPPVPEGVPGTLPDVLRWFERQYLPYRLWQCEHGGDAARQTADELGQAFARWCLDAYPPALHGGPGGEHLAIDQSRRLQATRHGVVTFWLLLDGLPYSDALDLLTLLADEPRLTVESCRPVLSPLPTITEFCKPAVLNGVVHIALLDTDPKPTFQGAVTVRRNEDPRDRLRDAAPGDVIVWSLLEPDATYHDRADRNLIRADVSGRLRDISLHIKRAVAAVPGTLSLRVVISTDHGRLLGPSRRVHPVPNGMKPHGRTAWGPSGLDFDQCGYVVDEGEQVATLDAQRFEIPFDCAVALDADAFLTRDGKGGREEFAHGGLYPEEVLVPWVELVRDRVTPLLRCLVAGKARSGAHGNLRVNVENPSGVSVTLSELRVNFGEGDARSLPFSQSVAAMSALEVDAALHPWPNGTKAGRAVVVAIFLMPDGTPFGIDCTTEIESEEMYRRDLSLEDL